MPEKGYGNGLEENKHGVHTGLPVTMHYQMFGYINKSCACRRRLYLYFGKIFKSTGTLRHTLPRSTTNFCCHVTLAQHREHVTTRKLQTTEEGLKYRVENS